MKKEITIDGVLYVPKEEKQDDSRTAVEISNTYMTHIRRCLKRFEKVIQMEGHWRQS